MLAAADVFALMFAALVAEWLPGRSLDGQAHELGLFTLTLPCWVLVARSYGLYHHDEQRTDHSAADEFSGVFHMITVCTAGVAAASFLTRLAHPTPLKLLGFWATAIPFVVAMRSVARFVARRCCWYRQNTLIVGAGEVGQSIARKIVQHPEYGANLMGFVDETPMKLSGDVIDFGIAGRTSDLPAIVRRLRIERVIIAFSLESDAKTLKLIRTMNDLDVQVDVVPRLYELVWPGVGIHTVGGLPLVGLSKLGLSRSSQLLKRGLDLVGACVALVCVAPFLVVVALAVRLDSPGPVFFRQTRMGAGDRTFKICKFRTMVVDAEQRKHDIQHLNQHCGRDERMFKIAADPRVTRIGRVLRRTSIDELPQLLNVLRGEMSLVGPRPLILEEDTHVLEWARERLRIKPGITGLWQVLGRSDIPFGEMVQLDYLYVTSWSIAGDLKLIAKTIPRVFRARATT